MVAIPPLSFFFHFFLEDKTSAPEVFSSCLFIPRAHLETRLVMISYYMVTRCVVISCRWSSHFQMKMHVFSTSFTNKSKDCGLNDAKYLFVLFYT